MVNLQPLSQWSLTQTKPWQASSPEHVEAVQMWDRADVPGTVAKTTGIQPPVNLDDFDWWYSTEFSSDVKSTRTYFCSEGLATVAEVWLNGEQILSSVSMFLAHKIDISDRLQAQNTLHVVFRSIKQSLDTKRARPRWKTNLVEHQNLRWLRTTLLGRIPSWTPPVKVIGPWQALYLETVSALDVHECHIVASLNQQSEGAVHVQCELEPLDAIREGLANGRGTVRLSVGEQEFTVPHKVIAGGNLFVQCQQSVGEILPWWPHTHGEPVLHRYRLELQVNDQRMVIKEGKLGFRRVEVDRTGGDVALKVNGKSIFCRGSCWSSADKVNPAGASEKMQQQLCLLKESGANMIRVGGTMVYETNEFYARCDELGLMVWQDFMFANMDYPFDDAEFKQLALREVREQLSRLASFGCISVFCGGSEVYQQAAMMGADKATWQNEWYEEVLPAKLKDFHCSQPYFPSSPCEGALPFHTADGISHFYGVGAYALPVTHHSVRSVKFTPECLAFSNIPCSASLKEAFQSPTPAVHTPAWKSGVPRDNSAGWDFEDVRDTYTANTFAVAPSELRYSDNETYFQVSAISTAQVMSDTMALWRSRASSCNGALTWFYQDLVPGAGWGILDSYGRPKAAYYLLKRVWQPQQVVLVDNDLDGYAVEVINERDEPLVATLDVALIGRNSQIVETVNLDVNVPPNQTQCVSLDQALGRFLDTTHAYKFGPQSFTAVVAELRSEQASLLSQSVSFPVAKRTIKRSAVKVSGRIVEENGSPVSILLEADGFVEFACLDARGVEFEDNYVCMLPGREYRVNMRAAGPVRGVQVAPLNCANEFRVT